MELRSILQKNLECYLPTTIIFDCPTPQELINYLSKEILKLDIDANKQELSSDRSQDYTDKIKEVTNLSNKELENLIDNELELM
jgi:hypothetical protein